MTNALDTHTKIATDLKALEDELLRKIGRNMMALQQIEGLLKHLLINSEVRTGPSEMLQNQQAESDQKIRGMTLGRLVTKFTGGTMVTKAIPELKLKDEHLAPFVTIRHSVETDKANHTQRTSALKVLVDERNELIHNFLPKWTRGSLESAQAVELHLDQQHARIRVEFELLKSFLDGLQRSRAALSSFAASPEFEVHMELVWLQGSPVVQMLATMSLNAVETNGWVSLQTAGQVLWKELNEDMSSLNERYGYKKLRPLLVAAQFFDLRDEPLANGCSRVFFKINDAEKAHQTAA